MRLLASRFLVTTIFTLLALPQLTFAWTKDYSYEHKMGDNDSRNLAKEAAVEQIKLKAAQEAGTYIQGTTTLTNGQLEETITQIGASIVKVVVQADKISVDETGHQLLTVTANATVDETVMQERIKALQEDANKAKLLQQLTSENEKLRAEMTALAQQRAQELDSEKLATIVAREVALRKDLATNLTSTEQVFKSIVSAIDIANQEALARKSEFDKIAAEWELNFFQPLRNPKILKADVADMKLSDNGEYYTGKIVIEWQNDPDGKIAKFVCTTSTCNTNLRAEGLSFNPPTLMSKDNMQRFLKMMESKRDLYSIRFILGNQTGFNHQKAISNYYHDSNGIVHNVGGGGYFTLATRIQEDITEFRINLEPMQSNPILKADIITPQQCFDIANNERALRQSGQGKINLIRGILDRNDCVTPEYSANTN
jgi:hypothetical protein